MGEDRGNPALEERFSNAVSSLDRSANEAAAYFLKSRRTDDQLDDLEDENHRPLHISISDYIPYAEKQLTQALR